MTEQPYILPCGCVVQVDHVRGDRLAVCRHDRYKVTAQPVGAVIYTASTL